MIVMACMRYAVNTKNPEVEICNKSTGLFFHPKLSTFPGIAIITMVVENRPSRHLKFKFIFFFHSYRRMPSSIINSIPVSNCFIFGFLVQISASVSFKCYEWKKKYGNYSTKRVSGT